MACHHADGTPTRLATREATTSLALPLPCALARAAWAPFIGKADDECGILPRAVQQLMACAAAAGFTLEMQVLDMSAGSINDEGVDLEQVTRGMVAMGLESQSARGGGAVHDHPMALDSCQCSRIDRLTVARHVRMQRRPW